MASTYSITFSLANHNVGYTPNPTLPINHQIEDAYATPSAQQLAMSQNAQVQVKRTDGRIRNYTIDSSRSDPAKNLIFLLPT
jgi:hypothetical protein